MTANTKRPFGALLMALVVLSALVALFFGPTERVRVVGTTLVLGALATSLWRGIFIWMRQGNVVLRRYSIQRQEQPFGYGTALLLFMFIALLVTWGACRAALFALELFGLLS